jgi:hypothetical protein
MVLLGGACTLYGPIVPALVLTFVSEALLAWAYGDSSSSRPGWYWCLSFFRAALQASLDICGCSVVAIQRRPKCPITLTNLDGGLWRSMEGNRQRKVRSFVQPKGANCFDHAEFPVLFGPANAEIALATPSPPPKRIAAAQQCRTKVALTRVGCPLTNPGHPACNRRGFV